MKLRTTPEGLIAHAADRARWIRLQNGTARLGRLREAEFERVSGLVWAVRDIATGGL